MLLRTAGQVVMIALSLTVCAARLHRHSTMTPMGLTQELNRCLSIIRVASRRNKPEQAKTVRSSSIPRPSALQ